MITLVTLLPNASILLRQPIHYETMYITSCLANKFHEIVHHFIFISLVGVEFEIALLSESISHPSRFTWRDASSWMEAKVSCMRNLFHSSLPPNVKHFRHHHSSFVFYSLHVYIRTAPQGICFAFFCCGNSISLHLGEKESHERPMNILLWKFFVASKDTDKIVTNLTVKHQKVWRKALLTARPTVFHTGRVISFWLEFFLRTLVQPALVSC